MEKMHGVDIGSSYTNERSARTSLHYIAEAKQQMLVDKIANAKFYSLLLDGSTDTGNIDNKVLLVVWCDLDGHDEKVHTILKWLGLNQFQEKVFLSWHFGIQAIDHDNCKKLISFGTDGASTNIANTGLEGIFERKFEWIYWSWCLAHRLELAVKIS